MNLPTTATELFESFLPQVLTRYQEKAKELGGIYAFRLTGEGGGEWSVDLTLSSPKVTKGHQANAECTIILSHEDFAELLKHPQLAMQLFLQGKLKVEGNPMLAMKVQKLLTFGSSSTSI